MTRIAKAAMPKGGGQSDMKGAGVREEERVEWPRAIPAGSIQQSNCCQK
jgi:hypothetical protein